MKRHLRWLPNALSISRIPLVALGFLLYHLGFSAIGIAVVIFGFFTDFLDGLLARILECLSDLGAFLDPIADIGAIEVSYVFYIGFTDFDSRVKIALAAMMAATTLRNLSSQYIKWESKKKGFETAKSNWAGKTSTALQMTSAGVYFLVNDVLGNGDYFPLFFLVLGSAFCVSLISGYRYVRKYRSALSLLTRASSIK